MTGEFDIDQFLPSSVRPDLALVYENLNYACRRCNGVKWDQVVDDPFAVMRGGRIETRPDGTVHGRDVEARRMVLALDLNSPKLVEWRTMWMRIVELAQEHDPDLLRQLIRFPPDLPDLRRLRPPEGNSLPPGLDESWTALAERNELPSSY